METDKIRKTFHTSMTFLQAKAQL